MPTPPATTPLVQLNIFNLAPTALFSFACGLLASPSVRNLALPLPDSGRGLRDRAIGIYRGTMEDALQALREGRPWWAAERQDLGVNDGMAIISASYPLTSDATPSSGPAYTPPADSAQREQLLAALTRRLASPAVVLQVLPRLSPGGSPSAPLVRLADVLFELGEGLTSDEGIVKDVAARWLAPLLASRGRVKEAWEGDEDDRELETAVVMTIDALVEGLSNGRRVDTQGVARGLAAVTPLDWAWIVEGFDRAPAASGLESRVQHPDVVALLMGVLAAGNDKLAGASGLFDTEWRNPLLLLRIIDAITSSPSASLSSIPALADSRLLTYEDAQDVPAHHVIASSWNCLRVWEVCARIQKKGEGEAAGRAAELLRRGAETMPDLALMGLAQVSVSGGGSNNRGQS